jgi:hypothetical protein
MILRTLAIEVQHRLVQKIDSRILSLLADPCSQGVAHESAMAKTVPAGQVGPYFHNEEMRSHG